MRQPVKRRVKKRGVLLYGPQGTGTIPPPEPLPAVPSGGLTPNLGSLFLLSIRQRANHPSWFLTH